MNVSIRIDLENAVFEDDPSGELAELLRALATCVSLGGIDSRTLRDRNGNTVGCFEVTS